MKRRYLIVEGITDVALVKYICCTKKISNQFSDFTKSGDIYKFNDLVIMDIGGQDNLLNTLKLLKEEADISKIGIIQDADNDFTLSENKITQAINSSGIDKKKIKYFLTPNNKDNGDLETLLLSTIQNNNILNCFAPYKECLTNNEDIHPKALNKAEVYAYTMFSKKGENLYKPQDSFIYEHKNKYTDTGLWDLNKSEFKPLIDFVLSIFSK